VLGVTLLGMGLTACQTGADVRLTFRPVQGSQAAYRLTVHSASTVRLGDAAPREQEDEAVFTARHTVLAVSLRGVHVEVALRRPGSPERTFVVRFDADGTLQGVEQVEGLPVDVLGDVGLAELAPAAAAVPQDEPLRLGQRWTIDEQLAVAGVEAGRLTGTGRLVRVHQEGGRRLAVVTTTVDLPLRRRSSLPEGTLALDGRQTTRSTTTYDLADGTVVEARSTTHGEFDLRLEPPVGRDAPAVTGTLVLDVRSDTRRTD